MPALSQRGQYIVLGVDQALLHILAGQLQASQSIATSLASLAADVKLIREHFSGRVPADAVGIVPTPGKPVTRKESSMPKKPALSTTVAKKPVGAPPSAAKMAKAAADLTSGSYVIVDNQDNTITITGVDANGAGGIDLSAVSDLTPPPVSDNPSVLTVDAPSGMTFGIHPASDGTANIAITDTYKDGSNIFTFTLAVTVQARKVVGIIATPGTPTTRP